METRFSASSLNQKPIAVVIRENAGWLMANSGVVGIAQGKHEGRDCIQVFLKPEVTNPQDVLPSIIEGYSVIFKTTGPFHPV